MATKYLVMKVQPVPIEVQASFGQIPFPETTLSLGDGVTGYIPVFDDREKAEAYGGEIMEIATVDKDA